MSPRIKYIDSSRKKSKLSLNKSYFCLSHNFQTSLHNADYLLYYLHMSVFSVHTFFLLYQSLRNEEAMSLEAMLIFPGFANSQFTIQRFAIQRCTIHALFKQV